MAVRRLRIRRYYCLGLDGNLQLPRESLRVALANTHGYCDSNRNCKRKRDANGTSNGRRKRDANGDGYRGAEVYADAQAASATSASAVRSALAHVSSGTRVTRESPVTRTSLDGILDAPK